MRISQSHSNRRAHNWLIYDVGDYWLQAHTFLYHGTLYDLGCGETPYKDWLLRYADHYVGVDWSDSLHKAKADIIANLNKPLPIESEVADTILSLSVMEHLSEPQIMLSEAYRILKPGGALVLQVPWQWKVHEEPFDFFRYTPYGLHMQLEHAGFSDIDVQAQAGFFTMITMKLNYFSLRLIRGPLLLRVMLRGFFEVFWYLGQHVAPLLDRLDRNWALEATGYIATARKSGVAKS